MINVFSCLLIVVFTTILSANDSLFEPSFDYTNFAQYRSPNSVINEWMNPKKFSVYIDWNHERKDTLFSNTNTLSLNQIDGVSFYPSKLEISTLSVSILSGISNSINYYLRLKSFHKNLEGVQDPENPTNVTSIMHNGLGDIETGFLIKGIDINNWQAYMILGMVFPTGDNNKKAQYPLNGSHHLGYVMQNSEGNLSLTPGVSIHRLFSRATVGITALARLPIMPSNKNYLSGKRLSVDSWMSVDIFKNLTIYSNIEAIVHQTMQSPHPDMDPLLSIQHNHVNTGYKEINGVIGTYVHLNWGGFRHYKYLLEYRQPLYQNVTGTQLVSDKQVRLGFRYHIIKD